MSEEPTHETNEPVEAQEAQAAPSESSKSKRPNQLWIVGLALSFAVASLLWRWLYMEYLETTALLFIGIPLILTIGMVFVPTKTTLGSIFKGLTLALLLSGVLLGEGFVCILMSAPIFYLVGFIVYKTTIKAKEENKNKIAVIAILPLVLMSFEGIVPSMSFSRNTEVTISQKLDITPKKLLKALHKLPLLSKKERPSLLMFFPAPVGAQTTCEKVGCIQKIQFSKGHGDKTLSYRIEHLDKNGITFRVIKDNSKIAHWLKWETFKIQWERLGANQTQVIWSAHFRRKLDPHWYFSPLERIMVHVTLKALMQRVARGNQ